jgi:hypothetical protein
MLSRHGMASIIPLGRKFPQHVEISASMHPVRIDIILLNPAMPSRRYHRHIAVTLHHLPQVIDTMVYSSISAAAKFCVAWRIPTAMNLPMQCRVLVIIVGIKRLAEMILQIR